jgi:large subunit ribosomal protein L6
MSRVAKKIINIPEGVNVSLTGNDVSVNSAKGTLNFVLTKEVSLKIDANEISVMSSDNQESIAMAGTTRSIINNMIVGLSKGYEKSWS